MSDVMRSEKHTHEIIIGIPVTETEYDRYEQIRGEMLASGRSKHDAELWAAHSIGIGSQFSTRQAHREEYARLVNA